MPEPQNTWRKYSLKASSSGSCAAILRTRRLTVNVTSTISSSVGVYPAAHQPQAYSSLSTLFNVVLELSTPPQPGHSTFHDSSKIPSRAACRKAAITCSSSSPVFAAKSSTLIRQRARSGASRTNASIASAVSGSADCRRTANRLLASLIVASPSRIRELRASFGLRESFADRRYRLPVIAMSPSPDSYLVTNRASASVASRHLLPSCCQHHRVIMAHETRGPAVSDHSDPAAYA